VKVTTSRCAIDSKDDVKGVPATIVLLFKIECVVLALASRVNTPVLIIPAMTEKVKSADIIFLKILDFIDFSPFLFDFRFVFLSLAFRHRPPLEFILL